MKSAKSQSSALVAFMLCALLAGTFSGCRKPRAEEAGVVREQSGVVAPELETNQLSGLPGAVYRSQAASPVHWQPWSEATLERARQARRLVFAVIAMPQQPGYQGVLEALASSRETVDEINASYVPVLVDGDAARETGILTADLCAEIKRPLQLPLFVWMTYEGNPVAWIPVVANDKNGVRELFEQSHGMVSRMWQDDAEYVLNNSRLDNGNRRARIAERKVTKVSSDQPATDVLRSLRQLASLYDPFSRNFDEAGGLFPSGALELLAVASQRPGVPDELRARCLATTRELLKDLLPSPMFDPLDGGVFSSRRGQSWVLPSFVRDCSSQGKVAVSLIEAYRATGDVLALERAMGVIAFAEKHYSTGDGLFAVGLAPEPRPEAWMWSLEDIRRILTVEEADWWIRATGMKGLGNLPSEVDPKREFFRSNTVGLAKSVADYAAERGQTPAEFEAFLAGIRAKLLEVRGHRLGVVRRDQEAHAAASLRMVCAYAAAYTATGDAGLRTKAVELLQRCREAFADGPRLRVFRQQGPASIAAGRAFLYALALQAVLDVAAISSDPQWLIWGEDLATTSAELFTGDGFLKECPDEARLIDLPVTDLVMLFDDSTAGLVSLAECRLAALGRPLVASFSELATPMPTYSLDRPVLHTDLLQATLLRHYPLTVVTASEGLTSEMRAALERLPVRTVQRRVAREGEEIPAGAVKVLLADDRHVTVSSPSDLQRAISPAAAGGAP